MLKRTVNKFSVSPRPSAPDSPGTPEVKPQAPTQRPNHLGSPPPSRETLTRSSNFLPSRIDQRVPSKNGGTSTEKPVAEATLMTCIERLKQDDFKSSQVRRTSARPTKKCAGGLVRCAPTMFFLCSVLCLCCRFRLQLITINCNRRSV